MRMGFALAVAVGLATCASMGAAQAPDGRALYMQQCRSCHGATGVAPQRMRTVYKTLPNFDAAFYAKRSDDSVVAVLTNGFGRNMNSFKGKLTKDEMTAIARYMRTLATPAAKTP